MNRPTINSRSKGSRGELEVASLIHEHLGVRLVRRLDQSRAGGFDLEVAPGQTGPAVDCLRAMALEVKRHGAVTPGTLASFWAQAAKQAEPEGLTPVLCWRANRSPWAFTVPLHWFMPGTGENMELAYTVTLTVQSFVTAVRER
jgi:hypothetical protein